MLLAAGCASPSGVPAPDFVSHEVADAYIPLKGSAYVVFDVEAAAVALGDGVAVTSGHSDNLIDDKRVIGKSADRDLMFFRTDKVVPALPTESPQVGERVIAYGQYEGKLRRADGVVTELQAAVEPQCRGCAEQSAFTFDGNAGPGFSGGPVIDAAGRLVGIVFGYLDRRDGGRTIYAYSMQDVTAELDKLKKRPPAGPD